MNRGNGVRGNGEELIVMDQEPRAAHGRGGESLSPEERMLLQAVAVLRTRCLHGRGYEGLSSTTTAELAGCLEATAFGGRPDVDRREAVALAHRILDDDNPELSSMWPAAGDRALSDADGGGAAVEGRGL